MNQQNFDLLCPELRQGGSLAAAVQAALEVILSTLPVHDPLGHGYARVEDNHRHCQVMVALEHRQFSVEFWDRGVVYGHLWCADLATVARAIQAFVERRCTSEDLARFWPESTIEAQARAHELGELVDYAWTEYLRRDVDSTTPEHLRELFMAAATRPRLRRLMPFLSMGRLCFSSRTGWPYTSECPMIRVLASGECQVFPSWLGEQRVPIFSGSVAEAVAAAEDALPPSVTGARDGTAENDMA